MSHESCKLSNALDFGTILSLSDNFNSGVRTLTPSQCCTSSSFANFGFEKIPIVIFAIQGSKLFTSSGLSNTLRLQQDSITALRSLSILLKSISLKGLLCNTHFPVSLVKPKTDVKGNLLLLERIRVPRMTPHSFGFTVSGRYVTTLPFTKYALSSIPLSFKVDFTLSRQVLKSTAIISKYIKVPSDCNLTDKSNVAGLLQASSTLP